MPIRAKFKEIEDKKVEEAVVSQIHVREVSVIRDLKQGRRRRLRERCLKILFFVTVIILRLLQVARRGEYETTF